MYHNGIYLEQFTGFFSSAGNNMTPTYFGKIATLGLRVMVFNATFNNISII
jgi:hypothetical protein